MALEKTSLKKGGRGPYLIREHIVFSSFFVGFQEFFYLFDAQDRKKSAKKKKDIQ